MGWTSPEVTTATWDGLWAALVEKARNPMKFKMDVSDVTVVDKPGYLARSISSIRQASEWMAHLRQRAQGRDGNFALRIVRRRSKDAAIVDGGDLAGVSAAKTMLDKPVCLLTFSESDVLSERRELSMPAPAERQRPRM